MSATNMPLKTRSPAAAAEPNFAQSGRPRKLRLIIGALVLIVPLLMTQTSAASAAVSLANGASAATQITCSQTFSTMRYSVTIYPRAGVRSQSVAYRMYVLSSTEPGFWTSWQTFTAPASATQIVEFPIQFGLTGNPVPRYFTVYVQYAWYYNGWTFAGEWINSYGQQNGGGGVSNLPYCAV